MRQEAHFGDTSLSNKVYLKRFLFKLQQDELQSFLDITSRFLLLLIAYLNWISSYSLWIHLAAFHPWFDLWIEQIKHLPDDQLTWANVTQKLFHEETKLARLE